MAAQEIALHSDAGGESEANQSTPIRAILTKSAPARRSVARAVENSCGGAMNTSDAAHRGKECGRRAREIAVHAHRTRARDTPEPICHLDFRDIADFCIRRAQKAATTLRPRVRARARDARDIGANARRAPFVKRSRCFLSCAVVIGVQCTSIRDGTTLMAPYSQLGGQQMAKRRKSKAAAKKTAKKTKRRRKSRK